MSNGCSSIGAGQLARTGYRRERTERLLRLTRSGADPLGAYQRHRHGLVVRLATKHGTPHGVVVTLRRGRYTIRVARAGRTLIARKLRLRQ